MYTSVPFGTVATGAQVARPLAIRVRRREVVRPLKIAYIYVPNPAVSADRTIAFAISRRILHLSQPPTQAEMLASGPVFFGVVNVRLNFATAAGFETTLGRVEVDLRGIEVAGELVVCCDQALGGNAQVKAEFFYDIAEVGVVAKATAVWRTEVEERPR